MSNTRAAKTQSLRTESERLFARYLKTNGLSFEYEPRGGGADFLIRAADCEIVAEVKELHEKGPRPQVGYAFNPYVPIRRALNKIKSNKQFKGYEALPRVAVIQNISDWQFCDRPFVVFGAMLGDPGIRFAIDTSAGRVAAPGSSNVFMGGGRLQSNLNTSFSAIAILSECHVPNPAFEAEMHRRGARLPTSVWRKADLSPWLDIRFRLYREKRRFPLTLGKEAKLTVFDNPFAGIPLPESAFQGRFDQRYRLEPSEGGTSVIKQVFAGSEVRAEAQRADAECNDVFARLDRYCRAVVVEFSPAKIILFGSRASGSATRHSDTDLLVVFAGDGDASRKSDEIWARLNPSFSLDLVTRSQGELDRRHAMGDPFVVDILRHGKVLYEAPNP